MFHICTNIPSSFGHQFLSSPGRERERERERERRERQTDRQGGGGVEKDRGWGGLEGGRERESR